MKNSLRTAVLTASVLVALTMGFTASAHAADRDMVRAAQIRLADLGYFSGIYDGVLGSATKGAIKSFQRHTGLQPTGKLTAATYDRLAALDSKNNKNCLSNGVTMGANGVPVPETWHFVSSEKIPVRNGELFVDEESKGMLHRFTVKLNGQPFLLADNQPGALRISEVFHLNGEDAIVFTAFRDGDSCKFRNTLVTIHANGTAARKHEFESCAPTNEVRTAHDALFVRFAETMNKDGYDRWDVWRYENTRLVRL